MIIKCRMGEDVENKATSNELALNNQLSLKEQATSWIESKLLPASIDTPEKAIVIVLKGKELGLEAMASFELIDVILGKPSLKPESLGL
jgi:hypothetical protein